jgi:hypothetical protein
LGEGVCRGRSGSACPQSLVPGRNIAYIVLFRFTNPAGLWQPGYTSSGQKL